MKFAIQKVFLFFSLFVCLFFGVGSSSVWAQNPFGPPLGGGMGPTTERESLHMNTIGAYSAGFVLQSFGYIGVLADVLSQNVYEPDVVRSMLMETVSFLSNANQQLILYQEKNIKMGQADQQFINGISDIIKDLTAEAEALAAFAQSHAKADLDSFKASREKAWEGIKKTLGVS
ncbi:MAG: hypothetical protein LBI10_04270 [Deltaproteobacteria bacterium]|jgi:hypothetical protein|nr:hypothetical protein [Deltaproteobacteria bacterium]